MRALTKVFRDLWLSRYRTLVMMLSLGAGLTSMGAVLSARTILEREMRRAYVSTLQASASFDVGEAGLPDGVLRELRRHPDVGWAERRATREVRWRVGPDATYTRGLLFVIEDFSEQRLALLGHEAGESVPPTGTMLVERSAMSVLGASLGDSIEVVSATGSLSMPIAGIVHDPALAPASTEQAGYFYASPETLALLEGPPRAQAEATGEGRALLDEVRILVARDRLNASAVEAQVVEVASWLSGQAIVIHEIRMPTPGQHPHQKPAEAVWLLFSIFSGLTLVLAAVLTASLLSISMARQVREVAVMKTLGAKTSDIARMYTLSLMFVSLGALLLSAPPTWLLGRVAIDGIAGLLNFDIVSYEVPHWVIALQVAAGVLLPLLTAGPAIARASRVRVLEALDDHGATRRPGLEAWVGSVGNRLLQTALRNALRVPKRLTLTLFLLAVAGGLFVGALSVADSWEAMTEEVFEARHYDLELHLGDEVSESVVEEMEEFGRVETWGFSPVTLANRSGLPLSRTHPDGGHGSFTMVAAPDAQSLVEFELRSGRWLRPTDLDAVVLNQVAAAMLDRDPADGPEARVELVVEGRRERWRVVGVVEEVAAPATAYVSERAFAARTNQRVNGLRIDLSDASAGAVRDREAIASSVAAIEARLEAEGVSVTKSMPLELLYNAMGEHVVVLIGSLLGLALMMALVGVLALASTVSISVVERTREFGILRAIGARPRQIWAMVTLEALAITLLSLPVALLVAIVLSVLVGQVVGQLAFRLPLPLDVSWMGFGAWCLGVLLTAGLASFVPARAANKVTVVGALAHV